MTPAIIYAPDTDTMYIPLRDGVADGGGADAGENLVIHYSATDVPMGYEIEHASKHPEHIAAALTLLREIEREQRQAA